MRLLLVAAAALILAAQGSAQRNLSCVSKKLPCANLGKDCERPGTAFVFKIRGVGGKMLGEGVLNHVFDREHLVVAEGWSLAHAPTAAKLAAVDAWGSRAVRITVLRHPIARAVSRYWFEGRWQLFAKGHDEEAAMPLHTWLAGDHCMPGAAAKGGRLWNCFSNYYVKSFAGWRGEAMCDPSADGCVGGVGPAQLEVAKQVLKSRFDAVLISEWLSSRPQVLLLGRLLCFAFDAGGALPRMSRGLEGSEAREVPSFRPKRPAGGHSNARPPDWTPSEAELARLRAANALDLDLFTFAADATRRRLKAHLQANPDQAPDVSSLLDESGWPRLPAITELGLGCKKC